MRQNTKLEKKKSLILPILLIDINICLPHLNIFSSSKIGKDIKRPYQSHLLHLTLLLRCKHFKYIDFCLNMANGNNSLLLQEAITVAETISQENCLYPKILTMKRNPINSALYSYKLPIVCSFNMKRRTAT